MERSQRVGVDRFPVHLHDRVTPHSSSHTLAA
jgi:hypothetical protein